jgi:hypothetical protein
MLLRWKPGADLVLPRRMHPISVQVAGGLEGRAADFPRAGMPCPAAEACRGDQNILVWSVLIFPSSPRKQCPLSGNERVSERREGEGAHAARQGRQYFGPIFCGRWCIGGRLARSPPPCWVRGEVLGFRDGWAGSGGLGYRACASPRVVLFGSGGPAPFGFVVHGPICCFHDCASGHSVRGRSRYVSTRWHRRLGARTSPKNHRRCSSDRTSSAARSIRVWSRQVTHVTSIVQCSQLLGEVCQLLDGTTKIRNVPAVYRVHTGPHAARPF